MRKDENGQDCPATLGEYRDLCASIGGARCRAAVFLDERIAEQGRDEWVIATDLQMRSLLMPLMLPEEKRPGVGVCVFVFDEAGRFLLGQRQGSHGSGTWGLPGGHVEFGEKAWQTAVREVAEETGIAVEANYVQRLEWVESFFEEEQKHYVSLYFAVHAYPLQVAKIMEPQKCREWCWVTEKTLPSPLFPPLDRYLLLHGVPMPPQIGSVWESREWIKR